MPFDVGACLNRIGWQQPATADLATLRDLQLAWMQHVPFENLDVFARRPVTTDLDAAFHKVIVNGRGGWCFEVNGLFADLLTALGFEVRRLGAAVLLAGPNKVIDHLTLEVMLDEPWLVDVGFGAGAPVVPMPLKSREPFAGLVGTFEFMPSADGLTLAELVEGVPAARYRFRRVAHEQREFEPASQRLQADRSLHWSLAPFATRLIDDAGGRVTLTSDRLLFHGSTPRREQPVAAEEWSDRLQEWFGIVEDFPPERLSRTAQE